LEIGIQVAFFSFTLSGYVLPDILAGDMHRRSSPRGTSSPHFHFPNLLRRSRHSAGETTSSLDVPPSPSAGASSDETGDSGSIDVRTFTSKHAEERVNESAEKLKQKIPSEFQDVMGFDNKLIKGSFDITSLSREIGSVVGILMDQQRVERSRQGWVKVFTTSWVKQTIPYVRKGLNLANVPHSARNLLIN